ncbi:ester cyclase [Burkholderia thailandensis]|uniref:ester cyclase n=1 Tax=Burkholderia thailandensis TaxID=57975 RepID=UPI00192E12FE|nr:ester cyclase [Burkholderia thailandensis]MBS2127066.1 ester cyclase [Burkholderia thailandensis]QRA12483.1 ester cyclase [Burkholderia thailandensis]
MPTLDEIRSLFDRWERVWNHDELDLVPTCVAPQYLRHEEAGDRIVTPESYAAEIVKLKKERPDFQIVAYDHAFQGDRAWYRVGMTWTDQSSGQVQTRACVQGYRIEDGKLVETWVMFRPIGSSWGDVVAQPTWTTRV